MTSTHSPKATPKVRPCDSCRRRKSRCVVDDVEGARCVLCIFHNQDCTFLEEPVARKRKAKDSVDGDSLGPKRSRTSSLSGNAGKLLERAIKTNEGPGVEEYDDLEGTSLLKKTLGLQNSHHSRYIGPTSVLEPCLSGDAEEVQLPQSTLRRAGGLDAFLLLPDPGTQGYEEEIRDLDAIEAVVAPHRKHLVTLYFRIVHPSFAILHKEVFLEKYARSHREFSPPLLASVYLLALQYWAFDEKLCEMKPPNITKLERLARKSLQDTLHRPKLSTVQAGLLLLQHTEGDSSELTAQLISIGYGLGLHLDANDWSIPDWEKGLRKRLGWALYMQDKWAALGEGRPALIASANWSLEPVATTDFPENAAHEDDQEGSSEVEKGIVMFDRMLALSEILTQLLETVFTVKASREFRSAGSGELAAVLEKVKPVQLKLKEWYGMLPDCLSMENTQVMKLSSVGSLRLAYLAAEMTLHRRILLAVQRGTTAALKEICLAAARTRFVSALEFVQSLKAQHLQSFWYFASAANFSLIATFGSLLCATSQTAEEHEWYLTRLKEYRFLLKINSQNGAKFLRTAIQALDINILLLTKGKTSHARQGSINSMDNSPLSSTIFTATQRSGDQERNDDLSYSSQVLTHLSHEGEYPSADHLEFYEPFVGSTNLNGLDHNWTL